MQVVVLLERGKSPYWTLQSIRSIESYSLDGTGRPFLEPCYLFEIQLLSRDVSLILRSSYRSFDIDLRRFKVNLSAIDGRVVENRIHSTVLYPN